MWIMGWKAGGVSSSQALPPESCVTWTVFFISLSLVYFLERKDIGLDHATSLNNNGIC